MKRTMLSGLVVVLALGLVGGPVMAEDTTATYAPPFDDGPAGGGVGSYNNRMEDGRVVVGRIYPVAGSNPLPCAGGGAFSMFEIAHTLTGPVETIRAEFDQSVTDSFVFVVLSARYEEDGQSEWLGSSQQRGPALLDGDIELDLDPGIFDEEDGLWTGDVISIQFGLQMASACPHANGGTVRFTEITVS